MSLLTRLIFPGRRSPIVFIMLLLLAAGAYFGLPYYRTYTATREVKQIFADHSAQTAALQARLAASQEELENAEGFLAKTLNQGKVVKELVETTAELKNANALVTRQLRAVNLDGCPDDFRDAANEMIEAWDHYAKCFEKTSSFDIPALFTGLYNINDAKKRFDDAYERFLSFSPASNLRDAIKRAEAGNAGE